MKLVAGSYERFLWGYDVKPKKQELVWKFAYPAHNGPVKCIAISGAVVATGGADDTIRVFDLNAQKDMGSLYKHEGAVTCLDFHNSHPSINHPTHLLSGSEDGSICIWDTDAWIHLLTMKAKKGPKAPVQDLSVHTSGLLALSIERNNNMKMWNLTKGRCSFTTKLPEQPEIVKFFPQAGESYALALGNVMEIRNAETGSTIHRLEHDKRIFCMAQRQDNMLVTGGEDCVVRAWDTRSGKQAWWMENAHTNRIKGVAIPESKSSGDADDDDISGDLPHMVASASSDGLLKVWDSRMSGTAAVPLMQAETKARLTCLVSSSGVKKAPKDESVLEGEAVVGKQHSTDAKEKTKEKKKKRKTGSDAKDDAGEDKALSGKKRQKKQGDKTSSTPFSSTKSPVSSTASPVSSSPGSNRKRPKSQDGAIYTPQHKKPKNGLPSKSSKSATKSPKSLGSGKSPKSLGSGKSPKSLGSGKSPKSLGSGKSPKSLGSGEPGKKGEKRRR